VKITIYVLFVIWSNGYLEPQGVYEGLSHCEWFKEGKLESAVAKRPARYECVGMTTIVK